MDYPLTPPPETHMSGTSLGEGSATTALRHSLQHQLSPVNAGKKKMPVKGPSVESSEDQQLRHPRKSEHCPAHRCDL